MLSEERFPAIEHDDSPVATLNPQDCDDSTLDADRLVITFFPEVIDGMLASGGDSPGARGAGRSDGRSTTRR